MFERNVIVTLGTERRGLHLSERVVARLRTQQLRRQNTAAMGRSGGKTVGLDKCL
jgi:hypothetical protein